MNFKRNLFTALFILISLLAVTYPRYNWNEIDIIKPLTGKGEYSGRSVDANQYLLLTDFYRGADNRSKLLTPYTFRPLVPFLASRLPFDSMNSINILNFSALLLTVLYLFGILKQMGFDYKLRLLGGMLFIFSFPVMYYGCIGLIDPFLIFLLTLGMYLIFKENWPLLLLLFLIGSFAKETTILLLPVAFAYIYSSKKINKGTIVWLFLFLIAYLLSIIVCREISPVQSTYIWSPSFETMTSNLARPRTYLSFLLTFGLPGIISVLAIFKMNRRRDNELTYYLPLIIGIIFSILLFMFSILSAYSDGRFIWTSYPFSIPLAVYYFSNQGYGEESILITN